VMPLLLVLLISLAEEPQVHPLFAAVRFGRDERVCWKLNRQNHLVRQRAFVRARFRYAIEKTLRVLLPSWAGGTHVPTWLFCGTGIGLTGSII
jgi:hypothetical protein